MQNIKTTVVNKKRKEVDRQIQQIQDNHKNIESDKNILCKYNEKKGHIHRLETEMISIEKYLDSNIDIILQLLENEGFICKNINNTPELYDLSDISRPIKLTVKGQFASNLREVHCLVFAQLIEDKLIYNLSPKQLVALFSCFTNISVQDDFKDFNIKTDDKIIEFYDNSNPLRVISVSS